LATLGWDGSLYGSFIDPNRLYSMSFGGFTAGTDAASAMVAGAVACLQGLVKQFYGINIMPEQIRDNVAGFTQCQVPTVDDLLGSADPPDGGGACEGDIWPQEPVEEDDPEGIPNHIPLFPEVMAWADIVLTTDWFDGSPLVDGINILRGDLVYGNVFSIKESDNNYLVLRGVPATPNSPPQVPSASGVNPPILGFGTVTDVEVIAHAPSSITNSITLTVESRTEGGTTNLMFVEMFDWRLGRWTFLDLIFPVNIDLFYPVTATDAQRFVRRSDRQILIRVWTIAIGNGLTGGRRTEQIVRHDLIDVDIGGGGGIFGP
jgi:hypothetical protein